MVCVCSMPIHGYGSSVEFKTSRKENGFPIKMIKQWIIVKFDFYNQSSLVPFKFDEIFIFILFYIYIYIQFNYSIPGFFLEEEGGGGASFG